MLSLLIGRHAGRRTGVLMVLAATASFGMTLWLTTGGRLAQSTCFKLEWLPELGIHLSFRGDPFGLFFAMLISSVGALVGIYSLSYIPALANKRVGQYYAALIAFMGSMLGVVLSDDLVLLFVFWEITSITSFLLIGFWYERKDGIAGAMTALQITALGGLAMMVGFVLVGVETGTFSISELVQSTALQQQLAASSSYAPALLLIFAGAFTKSAQWPFHFWLPRAMVAPTPVSTYLHAATMVKAGIFLVGRMLPVFGGSVYWSPILIAIGLLTFALGAYQAFAETDLKAILARSTLSTLGLIMFLYGLKAADQDVLQIFSHAVYKGALFLVAGMVEHATHTRDIRQLGGLKRDMPITFWLGVLGALSMVGLPPFFGFMAKESLYHELLHNEVLHQWPILAWAVIVVCVAGNAFLFAVSFKLIIGVFLGRRCSRIEHVHEVKLGLWMPAAILAGATLVVGLLGLTDLVENLVNSLSSDARAHVHVSLVPNLSDPGPLILSLITIGLGIAIYRRRAVVNHLQSDLNQILPTMQSVWDRSLDAVIWIAVQFSSRWQCGSLRWYLSGVLAFFVGLVIYSLCTGLSLDDVNPKLSNLNWVGLALCGLLAVAVMTVVQAKTRPAAAIAITATGFLVALIFVIYRSPDILLTQILIETVSTIFLLLILFFMPSFARDDATLGRRLWHIGLSCAVGLVMFALVFLSTSPSFWRSDNLAGAYLSRAVKDTGGHNAVNVVIVDFRAIDTTGEITVLVVVGLCVYGLLQARRQSP